MATSSCEGEGGCSESESVTERYSNLPDQVVHHIVSFLAITDLTRFSCVSKKCRELYLSTPSLKFDEFSLSNISPCYKRLNLLRSFDTFLIRRGDNKLHQFGIRWVHGKYFDHIPPRLCDHNHEKSLMIAWMHNAVRCNGEVLDLEISIFDYATPLAFPSCIFLCESLRSLSVAMNCKIQAPSTFSSFLKCLELSDVEIVDESFFKWISQSCKCIEVLDLDDVYGIENINIESSSLESFSFQCVNQTGICHLKISGEKLQIIIIDWRFDSPSNKSFNISAPNLKRFFWGGNLMNHSNMGELGCLEDVGFYLEPEEDEVDYVIEDLSSAHRRNFLILNEEAMKGLYNRGIMLPNLFGKICYLRMHIGSFVDDLVPSMVFLFGGMLNLSTLYLKSTPPLLDLGSNTSGFNMGYWKQQNFGFIHRLKDVTIQLSNGSNGMELARYMLEHAQNLEKMVIVYLPQQGNIVKRMLDRSKMISNGIVVFKENPGKRKLV